MVNHRPGFGSDSGGAGRVLLGYSFRDVWRARLSAYMAASALFWASASVPLMVRHAYPRDAATPASCGAQALRDLGQMIGRSFGEQDGEFVPAQARHDIDFTCGTFQGPPARPRR